jgi:hypothetical protein
MISIETAGMARSSIAGTVNGRRIRRNGMAEDCNDVSEALL